MDRLSEMNARLAGGVEDDYPAIYYMERLMQHMWEEHVSKDEDSFDKEMYARSYGFIMSQIRMLSEEMFRVRVDIELALGLENDQTRARIENSKKSWAHMEKQGEVIA